jgi:hypothetical protein
MKREYRISLKGPIKLSSERWYYEYPSFIEVYLSAADVVGNPPNGVNFRIPRRKIEASLKRMNAARRAGKVNSSREN